MLSYADAATQMSVGPLEVEIVAPKSLPEDWKRTVARMSRTTTLAPFSCILIDFVDAISKSILLDPGMRSFAELMALGHWIRRSHVHELQQTFRVAQSSHRLPRGLVLHFAPSNVDSIFVYSWLISLLVGNTNVVRLSTRRGEQLRLLESKLNDLLARSEFAEIAQRTLIVSYEHDLNVTQLLSSLCHVRVIWGGDATIATIRSVPLSPLASEIAFADRFSFAVFNSRAVASLSEDKLERLAEGFYADAFWFDQLACSSPRLIVWVGDRGSVDKARNKFWRALESRVLEARGSYPPVVGITRMAAAYSYAAAGIIDRIETAPTSLPCRCHLSSDAVDFREQHCGGGLFLEREVEALEDILTFVNAKDQTMSQFGFARSELEGFASRLPARAVDRIVSVGNALQFATVWDGVDLFQAFTREVSIAL